jgi:hypothetical protein
VAADGTPRYVSAESEPDLPEALRRCIRRECALCLP